MKDFLKDLIKNKENEILELKKRSDASGDLAEVRSIGVSIDKIISEIDGYKIKLRDMELNEKQERENFVPQVNSTVADADLEKRKAFRNFVINQEKSDLLEMREAIGQASDLGVAIPESTLDIIRNKIREVNGTIYSRVKKTNVKGGVRYPIADFTNLSLVWFADGSVTAEQHTGEVTGSIDFKYYLGEVRLSRSILETTLSLPQWEEMFADAIADAYIKGMDKAVLTGKGDDAGEPTGIITEANKESSRIPENNIIYFTDEEMADWKQWQVKLFSKVPIRMRKEKPEFIMTVDTYEANIKTLVDDNNKPVYQETYNPVDGEEICRFKGRDVYLSEEGDIKNFDDAEDGDVFGLYWVPEKAYAINTNLEFSVIHYIDHNTNKVIDKGLVIADGKPLDVNYLYVLKKRTNLTKSKKKVEAKTENE